MPTPNDPIPNPTPTPKARGGRRPGAGAPAYNLNAFRTGAYSRQAEVSTLILAAYPELRTILKAGSLREGHEETLRRQNAVRAAYRAILEDPDLAQSIKGLVQNSLRKRIAQLEARGL
jgi:hypothetical protein